MGEADVRVQYCQVVLPGPGPREGNLHLVVLENRTEWKELRTSILALAQLSCPWVPLMVPIP